MTPVLTSYGRTEPSPNINNVPENTPPVLTPSREALLAQQILSPTNALDCDKAPRLRAITPLQLANHINEKRISLNEWCALNPHVPFEELIEIVKQLTYLKIDANHPIKFSQEHTVAIIEAAAPNVIELDIARLKTMSVLPPLQRCKKLICWGCENLQAISNLKVCEEIDCSYCPKLSILEKLSACKKLTCDDCDSLQWISNFPSCEELNCSSCQRITKIENMTACKKITCHECDSLQSISDLPVCEELYCSYCLSLTFIGNLPLCTHLQCSDCKSLVTLPESLPSCHTFEYDGCPRIQAIPQLSLDLHLRNATFMVDIESLKSNPIDYLNKLGTQFLLNNYPFPDIKYESTLHGSCPAIDVDGVKRDFFSRLFERLFVANDHSSFLLGEKSDEGFLPIYRGESDETSFRIMGRLLGFCALKNSNFRTGRVFDPKFFRLIGIHNLDKLYSAPDILSQEEKETLWIQGAVSLKISDPELRTKVLNCVYGQRPDLSDNLLKEVIDALMQEVYFTNTSDTNDDNIKLNPEEYSTVLKMALLRFGEKDRSLQAASIVTSEMRHLFDREEWEDLMHTAWVDESILQARIEGELSAILLKQHIVWIPSQTSGSERRFIQIKQFLENWIDRVETAELTLFVRAVTGNNTLPSSPLRIELHSRGKDNIPVAHTCFLSFELSDEIESQNDFDQKLRLFLDHALIGNGFNQE